jgi:hypothetical protein
MKINIIALGESWAEHIGQTFADIRYGTNSSAGYAHGIEYLNNFPVQLTSSHLNLLEDYSPFRLYDNTRWIPYGLYYDLIDNRNDFNFIRVRIHDQVLGYTNLQMFDALDNDIYDPISYRLRLLSENNNNQSINLTTIFNEYGY